MRDAYENARERRRQAYRSPSIVVKQRTEAPALHTQPIRKQQAPVSYPQPITATSKQPAPHNVAKKTTKAKALPTQPVYSTKGIPATLKPSTPQLRKKPQQMSPMSYIGSHKPTIAADVRTTPQPHAMAKKAPAAQSQPQQHPVRSRQAIVKPPTAASQPKKAPQTASDTAAPLKKEAPSPRPLTPPPTPMQMHTPQKASLLSKIKAAKASKKVANTTTQQQSSQKPMRRSVLTNAIKHSASQNTLKVRKKASFLSPATGFYATAAVFATFGGYVIVQSLQSNQAVEQQAEKLRVSTEKTTAAAAVLTTSDQVPDQKEPERPDYREVYEVAPKLPRIIRIPSLSVYSRVLQAGVDKTSTIMTPASVYDTAWYNGSARPGETGASVINGHVGLPQGYGVFKNIKNLRKGAIIEVEKGDGVKKKYRVTSVVTMDTEKVDMSKLLTTSTANASELNLITCGGSYDAKENTYEKRTIVRSTLVR